MHAVPERLRDVITTRRYTNPRLSLPLCFMAMSLGLYGDQSMD